MDITLRCPECRAEWPTTEVKAIQETLPQKLTPRHITFQFPCGCWPTLSRMLRSKTISKDDGVKILAGAQERANNMRAGG